MHRFLLAVCLLLASISATSAYSWTPARRFNDFINDDVPIDDTDFSGAQDVWIFSAYPTNSTLPTIFVVWKHNTNYVKYRAFYEVFNRGFLSGRPYPIVCMRRSQVHTLQRSVSNDRGVSSMQVTLVHSGLVDMGLRTPLNGENLKQNNAQSDVVLVMSWTYCPYSSHYSCDSYTRRIMHHVFYNFESENGQFQSNTRVAQDTGMRWDYGLKAALACAPYRNSGDGKLHIACGLAWEYVPATYEQWRRILVFGLNPVTRGVSVLEDMNSQKKYKYCWNYRHCWVKFDFFGDAIEICETRTACESRTYSSTTGDYIDASPFTRASFHYASKTSSNFLLHSGSYSHYFDNMPSGTYRVTTNNLYGIPHSSSHSYNPIVFAEEVNPCILRSYISGGDVYIQLGFFDNPNFLVSDYAELSTHEYPVE
ncbi:hypothetical protein PCE1_002294 [Barthelona sp. PCE]